MKLSRELSKRDTGRTLYILDEPTTGLHFEDVRKLLDVLDRMVEAGNTVIVIEHNLEVIKSADHIIDLGPEGGEALGLLRAGDQAGAEGAGIGQGEAAPESGRGGEFADQVRSAGPGLRQAGQKRGGGLLAGIAGAIGPRGIEQRERCERCERRFRRGDG